MGLAEYGSVYCWECWPTDKRRAVKVRDLRCSWFYVICAGGAKFSSGDILNSWILDGNLFWRSSIWNKPVEYKEESDYKRLTLFCPCLTGWWIECWIQSSEMRSLPCCCKKHQKHFLPRPRLHLVVVPARSLIPSLMCCAKLGPCAGKDSPSFCSHY